MSLSLAILNGINEIIEKFSTSKNLKTLYEGLCFHFLLRASKMSKMILDQLSYVHGCILSYRLLIYVTS